VTLRLTNVLLASAGDTDALSNLNAL